MQHDNQFNNHFNSLTSLFKYEYRKHGKDQKEGLISYTKVSNDDTESLQGIMNAALPQLVCGYGSRSYIQRFLKISRHLH